MNRPTETELLVIACNIFVDAFTPKKDTTEKVIDYDFDYPPEPRTKKRKSFSHVKSKKKKRREKKQVNWQEWTGESTEPILQSGYL